MFKMTRIKSIVSALLISSLVLEGFAASLPKGIEKCKLSDASSNSCLTTFAQNLLPILVKGIPEIGIPNLNPMKIPDFHNKDPILNFKFINNEVFELKPGKIEEFKIDQNKKRMYLTIISSIRMDSDYTADGRILILPVVGDGKSSLTMTIVKTVYKIDYEVAKDKDGKNYLKIMKYKATFLPEHVKMEFTNLFNGNKELADGFHKFANENWKEIFTLFSKDPVKAYTDTVIKHMTTLFLKITLEEMFQT